MQKPKSIKPSICLPLCQLADVDMPEDITIGSRSWITLKIGSLSFPKFLLGSQSHMYYFAWTLHTNFPVLSPPSCPPNGL